MSDLSGTVRLALPLLRRNPGFSLAAVLVLGIGVGAVSLISSTFNTVVLQPLPYPEPNRLVARIEALPGVRAVGTVDVLPFVSQGPWNTVWAEGHAPPSAAEAWGATRRFVSEGFFAALGVPLRAGRSFEVTDALNRAPVTIINEVLARQFFPGGNPIGKRLVLEWPLQRR
jgi:hypothetical protein